jgi:two-component system, NarL family, nitrate/nitrite response regulator NarL
VNSVVVCETEPIAVEGLRSLLELSEDLRVAAAESCFADAIDAVRELGASLLILDRNFGFEAVAGCLASLRASSTPIPIIVWGSTFSEAEALRFIHAGATGVLRKTASLETVLECIRTVRRGHTWLGADMVRDPVPLSMSGHSPLTAREREVVAMVERGLKNKDIAEALGIRTGTVKIHLKHIFEKTGIHGRYGLALSGLKEKRLLVA